MMAKSYVYRGEPLDDPWLGYVQDGAVAYFEGRPPDGRWHETETPVVQAPVTEELATEEQVAELEREEDGTLRQPNKAASADDWKSYALAHGGFQESTGVHPDDATRKAIVDHYTADQSTESAYAAQAPAD